MSAKIAVSNQLNSKQVKAALELVKKHNNKKHKKVVSLMKKAADDMNKANLSRAKSHIKKAMEIEPDNFDLLQMMGLILQHEDRKPLAKEYYEKALMAYDPEIISGKSYIKLLINIGQICSELDQFKEAEDFFSAVLELDMTNTVALAKRARLYTECGFLDKAYSDHKQIIFFPDRDEYKHLGIRFNAHTSIMQSTHIIPDESDIYMLQKDIEKCTNPVHKLKYEFALANGLEKLKRYDEAFAAYKRGNDLKRKRISYSRNITENQADAIIQTSNRELLEQFKGVGDECFKPIFVLGLPRSGTTVTESILGAHPGVNPAGELSFISDIALKIAAMDKDIGFPKNCNTMSRNYVKSLVNFYKDNTMHFLTNGATTFVDKMPGNFWNIGLILMLFPNAKIIHLYKNPMDACISLFRQHFANGHHYCYNMGDLGHYYCQFRRIMKHLNNEFGDRIHNVSYEHFVSNIHEEAPRLFDFCDLEWDEKYLEFYKSKRRVKTASVQQVRKGIYTSAVERWRKFDVGDNLIIFKKMIKDYLPEHVRKEVDDFDDKERLKLENLKEQGAVVKHFNINVSGGMLGNKPKDK